jgi:hypothetical protein
MKIHYSTRGCARGRGGATSRVASGGGGGGDGGGTIAAVNSVLATGVDIA